ncbi:M57 family metalloprotease [Mucilaginibacter glaciei]|uniref:Protease n=1 Tax=Mucilaginibacter glaciei TaxID=2772109 RepID=A0A926P0M8_9SPHI|nr:M57 family metalloprotease [Mucilaginibacter glaciei]MBD1395488.1 protease [Mucilaginibacter glaciei]
MKKKLLFRTGVATVLLATALFACKKGNQTAEVQAVSSTGISASTLKSISELGFSTTDARKVNGGYLVEGDILLTDENLTTPSTSPNLRIAEEEQYRTTNVVKNLPRTVTVSVSNVPTVYATATQQAIARYNALNLTLKFQYVSSGGQIQVVGFNEGPSGGYITLGSSGFPTSSGNPYSQIQMNTNSAAYGSNPNVGYLTSVLQHEMGHCIGFRHTDYFNRAYSCGGTATNEGASNVGAVRIPGTPSTADAASFMLACSNGGDRTFNANDKIALNYLY